MLGEERGILPNTRLGKILAHLQSQARELRKVMHEVLTFDKYPPASETINKIVEKVDSMPMDEIMKEAQAAIDRYHQEKIGIIGDGDGPDMLALRTTFPVPPTVEAFSKIFPDGHFDPHQYLASGPWGVIAMRLDYGRKKEEKDPSLKGKGYEQALANFDLEKVFREALVMALAFERIPA
jgi:hypothetical protein